MGDVLPFVKPSSEAPISPEEFRDVLLDESTRQRAAATITALCDFRQNIFLPRLHELGWPRGDQMPYGTVHTVRIADLPKRLIISPLFPQTIHDHSDLSRVRSLEMAADFVHGYNLVIKSLPRWEALRTASQYARAPVDFRREVWTGEYSGNPANTVPYRFAGAVALGGQEDLVEFVVDREDEGAMKELPPHIAGLINPFTEPSMQGIREKLSTGDI